MMIVAAVQIERRPGRPSLASRRQTVTAAAARAMINNNNLRQESILCQHAQQESKDWRFKWIILFDLFSI